MSAPYTSDRIVHTLNRAGLASSLGVSRLRAEVYSPRSMSWFPPDLRGHTPNRVHALRKAARIAHLKRSMCNRSAPFGD